MKKKILTQRNVFLIFCFLGLNNVLFSQTSSLLLEEDFEYATGTDMSGTNAWDPGATGTNRVTVSEQSLTYAGYPNAAVKAVSFVPLSDRIQKSFEGSRTGTYYYSFLISVSSAGSGDFFAGFFSANAFRGRAYIKAEGTGFQFGLVKTTTGTVTYTSGTPFSFGTTYLVVVKYEFVTGTGNDIVSLYVNPDLTANDPGLPAIGPLTDTGSDITANVFALQGRNNAGSFTLDGIRITTNWAAVKGDVDGNHYLELPPFISSYMVLQRDTPLKFWGWGSAGDTVKVEFTRQSTVFKDSVKIDENGRWLVQLPAQTATIQSCQLKFSLKNHPATLQTLEDILVGDVWLAGGQSNMEKKVNHLLEVTQYVSEADNFPLIRSFRATYNAQTSPQEKVNGSSAPWLVCNSAIVADNVSAVAYVFARDVQEQTGIPIGIMQAYRGGTEIETWISPQKFAEPEYCKIAGRNTYLDENNSANTHSVNFNGQINPLKGFPLKGFIWYQGESNTKRPNEYRYMMKMLIEDWRTLWGQGDLPFYYIQMFNVAAPAQYEEATWADLREQQRFLLYDKTVPNTGMAVIIDTNEEATNSDGNIRMHPKNKKPAGERLAKIALRDTYGYNILAEGPILNRYKFSNDSVYLYFKNYGDGLKIKAGDTELQGFVISGNDKSFKSGIASILNDSTVMVKSELVSNPVAVRYAWARNPICNLYNSIDIPAMPFRTDIWQLSSYTQSQTSCTTASSDASLVSIMLNGVDLSEFNPLQFNYFITSEGDDYPSVTAITNDPWAQLEVTENKALNKIIITVTAENGLAQTYEINVNVTSADTDKNAEKKVNIFQENDAIVIQNHSSVSIDLKIYNISGQCVFSHRLKQNETSRYRTVPGIYLVNPGTGNFFKFIFNNSSV